MVEATSSIVFYTMAQDFQTQGGVKVVASPASLALSDLREKYETEAATPQFDRLYQGDSNFAHMFAVLHKKLNKHFEEINGRADSTKHYWADNSREMISLIKDLHQDLYDLKRAGVEVKLDDRYQSAIERCEPWLAPSGGSAVPEDFQKIEIVRHEPVFTIPATTIKLKKTTETPKLKFVGEGSYARVYSYIDPDYGIRFALKRAKSEIGTRDLERFRNEFKVMNGLSFPYVVAVYQYNDEKNEYGMEFCDETIRDYIKIRNNSLSFSSRKRIALQFLYGINYLHSKGLLHRDISLQNVLLKVFDDGAVLVKLSDFGLVKDQSSTFTRTSTEMRGSIRDPLLHDFKSYSVHNEIYPIGWILSYIFTGRESLTSNTDRISQIVQKCTVHDFKLRYQTVLEIIAEVEKLEAEPTDAPA